MNAIRPLVLALAVALLGSPAWAEEAHHPKAGAPAAKVPKAASDKTAAKEPMREMHKKMMSAKTPEQRSAPLAEHQHSTHGCMAMMGGMAGADKDSMKGGMPADLETRQQMMEKRMETMEAMMQMMVDRLPPAPAK